MSSNVEYRRLLSSDFSNILVIKYLFHNKILRRTEEVEIKRESRSRKKQKTNERKKVKKRTLKIQFAMVCLEKKLTRGKKLTRNQTSRDSNSKGIEIKQERLN